jgi:hypothetical protein
MDGRNTFTFEKFSGDNFRQWKFQLQCALNAKGLDITQKRPEKKEEDSAWSKNNGLAMFIISSAMDLKQITLVENCETAAEMIDKLNSVYEQKSELNKMIIHERFYEYKMTPNDTIAQHVSKVESLGKQLKEIGEDISDTALITKILSSLPSKYRMVRQAWMSLETSKQTITNLTARLLDEEASLNAEDTQNESNALFTSGRKPQIQTGNKKNRIVCYSCHKRGHYAKECYSKKRNTQSKLTNYQKIEKSHNTVAFNAEEFACASSDENVWILDSGASAHMSFRREFFTDFTEFNKCDERTVQLGNHICLAVKGKGNIFIRRINSHGDWEENIIEDVLYVPELKKNLFSEGVITKKGFKIVKQNSVALIYKNEQVIIKAVRNMNNLYEVLMKTKIKINECNVVQNKSKLQTWHERLGHLNVKEILKMESINPVFGIGPLEKDFVCEACLYGKQCRLPFKSSYRRESLKPGDLIYSDVCGPMSHPSIQGAKYFVLFKDAASSFKYVYFLKYKSDVFYYFKQFDAIVTNKFGHHTRILHTDNGREYVNKEFMEYMKKYGIEHECTAPYTPEQNGRAERELRSIVESARSMLYGNDIPTYLWAEAVNCAVYLLNRTTSSQSPNKSPYEIWTEEKPDLKHVKTFGCTGYVHIPDQLRTKFNKKSEKLILVGYQGTSNNYRMYNPQTRKITISRNVIFDENIIPIIRKNFTQIQMDTDVEEENPNIISEEVVPIEQCQEQHEEIENTDESCDSVPIMNNDELSTNYNLRDRDCIKMPKRYELNMVEFNVPSSYQEAVHGPDASHWNVAIQEELKAHEKNNTWSIIDLPINKKPITSKWVFKMKNSPNGKYDTYKARLCARGFSQVKEVDYFETFAPTTRYDSIRILLSVAAFKNYEILQFDVKTAFLYGELKEDIYMEIPEGLNISEKKICKLNKSLYGLKQAARIWNKTFSDFLKNYGFMQCDSDNCVFITEYNSVKVLLVLYVDDGLIMSKCKNTLQIILNSLKQNFDIKICKLDCFVGMQIENTVDHISVKQTNYINQILQKFCMSSAKFVSTPSDINVVLRENHSENTVCNFPYREAVGSLLFLSSVSRPDISYAVNVVSRFINNFNHDHVNAVKRIMRYLMNTKNYGILYKKSKFSINGYSDSDYAGDIDSRRSTTGYLFTINGGPITWSSRKQKTVALSTTEAEYMAACEASKEILWIKQFLLDIGEPVVSIKLFIDNQSAIKLIQNPVFHNRSKHIDIRYKFIREKVESGDVVIEYVPSECQLADILTKSLSPSRFEFIRNKVMM